jgi:uncharacterized RDD family membrane protein YckC
MLQDLDLARGVRAPTERADATGSQDFVASLDVAIDLPIATAGSRGLAHALDFLVVSAIQVILAFVAFGGTMALSGLGVELGEPVLALLVVATFVVQWGYFVAFELAWEGQTPGKKALGLRVVDESGGRAAFTKLAIRNLLRVVDFLPLLYGVGVLVMLASGRGQRVGDLAAGTLVVTTIAPRRRARVWPAGFQGKEVALVERWFDQRATLTDARRRKLALELAEWLRRTHPDALPREHAALDPESLLERAFPAAPDA